MDEQIPKILARKRSGGGGAGGLGVPAPIPHPPALQYVQSLFIPYFVKLMLGTMHHSNMTCRDVFSKYVLLIRCLDYATVATTTH